MAKGNYDHPSYITRQLFNLGVMIAGTTTQLQNALPFDMTLRNVVATVRTAGTATGYKLTIQSGTTSLGSITLGTGTAGVTGTSGDLNTKITQGTLLNVVTSGDATGIASVVGEIHISPDTGTWS